MCIRSVGTWGRYWEERFACYRDWREVGMGAVWLACSTRSGSRVVVGFDVCLITIDGIFLAVEDQDRADHRAVL